MPFDRQRRLVFLHIPKTAGSSVEQALNLFGPWQQENLQTGFGLIQSRDLLAQNLSSNFLQHLTLTELEKLFPDVVKDAVLFSVVRDPWRRLLSSFRHPDPDLVAYYHWRTQGDLHQLSLEQYIDVARWLPHPHLRPQLDTLVSQPGGTQPDRRIHVFRQEQLQKLEHWLQQHVDPVIRLGQSNPARRPLPELPEADVQALEQQVRWLYASDAHAFGYPLTCSSPGEPARLQRMGDGS